MFLILFLILGLARAEEPATSAEHRSFFELFAPHPSASAPPADPEDAARDVVGTAARADEAGDLAEALRLYRYVVEQYATTGSARTSRRRIAELEVVGTAIPTLDVARWFGTPGALSDHPTTLLVFFEAWCPHCKREVPKLQGRGADFAARGIGVIGLTNISRSATPDSVTEFIAEHGLTFPVAQERDGTMSERMGVRGVPAVALVSDGVVVWRGHPTHLTDDLLDVLLP